MDLTTQQPSFWLAVSLALVLAPVAAWAFFWWLSGRANAGLRRRARVVLCSFAVLYLAMFLYTVFGPTRVS